MVLSRDKGARITVHPKNLGSKLQRWQYRDIPNYTNLLFEKVIIQTLAIMKEEAPVKTGRLRESIQIKTKQKHGTRDRRYKVSIGPTAYYAKFVEKGTAPSMGRFVAAIEKRVRWGMHPGTRANPFIDRTYQKLRNQMDTGNLLPQIRKAFKRRIR